MEPLILLCISTLPELAFGAAGLGTVAIIAALLGVAAGAGKKPLRLLDKNCAIPAGPTNEAEAKALAQRFQAAGIEAGSAIGGEDALGPPEGDPIRNEDFGRAWATEMLLRLAPECLQKLGVERGFASNTNEFGSDFSEYEGPTPPPDVFTVWEALMQAIRLELTMRGYALGDQTIAAIDTDAPIGDTLVDFLMRPRAALAPGRTPSPGLAQVRVAGPRRRGRWESMR